MFLKEKYYIQASPKTNKPKIESSTWVLFVPCYVFHFFFLDGNNSQVLQEVELPILTQKECMTALSRLKIPISGHTFLCTGFPDGGKDACQVGGGK